MLYIILVIVVAVVFGRLAHKKYHSSADDYFYIAFGAVCAVVTISIVKLLITL